MKHPLITLFALLMTAFMLSGCTKTLVVDAAVLADGARNIDAEYALLKERFTKHRDSIPANDMTVLATVDRQAVRFRQALGKFMDGHDSVGEVVLDADELMTAWTDAKQGYFAVKQRYCQDNLEPITTGNCPATANLPADLQSQLIRVDIRLLSMGQSFEQMMEETGRHDVTNGIRTAIEIVSTAIKMVNAR